MTQADTVSSTEATPQLPASLRLGPVHLTVADLDRSVAWYQRALGLKLYRREKGSAELGDGEETVVVVREDPHARPPSRTAGLYHYALLYPSREELARAALRLSATQTPIQGASDHGTHEAIYLADADGNGIELAADRSREQWPTGLGYDRGPAPLDSDSLLATVVDEQPPEQVGAGLRVGHLHLHVGGIDEAIAFYSGVIGFELQANIGTAAFVSAGGYHHHLGFNVWRGQGVGPPPPHTIGLRHWTVELPADALAEVRTRVQQAEIEPEPSDHGFIVRDPWQTAILFRPNEEGP